MKNLIMFAYLGCTVVGCSSDGPKGSADAAATPDISAGGDVAIPDVSGVNSDGTDGCESVWGTYVLRLVEDPPPACEEAFSMGEGTH